MVRAPKSCALCGREIEWRKKWERDWEQVKYCSKSCRAGRGRAVHQRLEDAILRMLAGRSAGATMCPSEAARAVDPDNWRSLMEPARMAARRLAEAGRLEVTQKGRVVDASSFRGPIRLRLVGVVCDSKGGSPHE